MHGNAEFLPVGRDQRRAAVDTVIVALRVDDHRFAELTRAIDDRADDARRENALGIVGQNHRAASSLPISPMNMHCAPRAPILRATLPAPPISISLRATASTGVGASGEIRLTSP